MEKKNIVINMEPKIDEGIKSHSDQLRRLIHGDATEIDKRYIKKKAEENLADYEEYINE